MAKYRLEALLDAETSDTATTKNLDIDLSEVVSRITVEYKGTNNGSTPTAHGAKMVSKIELADGSDILYSLSGIEAQAANYYENGEMPFAVHEYRNDVQNIQTFQLNFGRYVWDELYALDPKRFRNLQLKITHNKASGGSSPDASTMSVFADVFDERQPSPQAFLQTKEHFTYSLTSSAQETIDLPVDLPLRMLMVQSLSGGKQPWEQYNKIKHTMDEGRKTIINDLKTSDLLKLMQRYPRIEESFLGSGTGSAVDHFVTPTYDAYGNISNLDAALTNNYLAQDYGGTQAVVGDSGDQFQVHMSGLAPHGATQILLTDPLRPETWHVPNPQGSEKLRITAGTSVGSSSTAEVVVQQVRRY